MKDQTTPPSAAAKSAPTLGSFAGLPVRHYLIGGSRHGSAVTVANRTTFLEFPVHLFEDGTAWKTEGYRLTKFAVGKGGKEIQWHYVVDGMDGHEAANRLGTLSLTEGIG